VLLKVLIVLGYKNNSQGVLPKMSIERAYGAINEYQKRPDSKFLLTGGISHAAPKSHAYYMAQLLICLGVEENAILGLAEESQNTVEDAWFSKQLLEEHSVESICVVTSQVHVARARLIFEHFFEPAILTFIGTPNGVNAKLLQKLYEHEKRAIETIWNQGGIKIGDRLLLRETRTADDLLHES
jgi:uncharacterized SAM-binding protein YcdF (DUF218 family)